MPNKSTVPYTPTVWTKTVDGIERERTATSISDEVAYKFDGWSPRNAKAAADAEKNSAATVAAVAVAGGGKPTDQK